jgi:hypothetical protein
LSASRIQFPNPDLLLRISRYSLLESLGLSLGKRYGIDFLAIGRDDIRLGEIYERAPGLNKQM